MVQLPSVFEFNSENIKKPLEFLFFFSFFFLFNCYFARKKICSGLNGEPHRTFLSLAAILKFLILVSI